MANNSTYDKDLENALETISHVKFWLYGLIIPIVCVPGIIGSVASMLIFSNKKMRSSLHILLAGLSFFDTVVLIMALFIYPPMTFCVEAQFQETICNFFWSICLVLFPLSLIAQFCSVWTCVLITIDRFVAIKYPFKARVYATNEKAYMSLTVVSVFGLIYGIPSTLELKHDDQGHIAPTELRKSDIYIKVYKVWCYLVFYFLIPWAIMIFLNFFVAQEVRRASRRRQQMNAQMAFLQTAMKLFSTVNNEASGRDRTFSSTDKFKRASDRRSTIMALLVTLTFLIFNFPAFINNCLEAIYGVGGQPVLRRLLIFISNLLICINSGTNVIIYCALGKRFRNQFLRMMCLCFWKSFRDRLNLTTNFAESTRAVTAASTPNPDKANKRFLTIDAKSGTSYRSRSLEVPRNPDIKIKQPSKETWALLNPHGTSSIHVPVNGAGTIRVEKSPTVLEEIL